MKVCIIGNSLTSLALAKVLVNKEIFVDIFYKNKNLNIDKTRTIGISKSNIEYFNQNISNISKILWPIKKIKIFSEISKNEEIINFEDQNNLFSIVKNYEIYNQLATELSKSKYYKSIKNFKFKELLKKNYNLFVNCESDNEITKKFFSRRFEKKYNSCAFTTIIKHKELAINDTAVQFFTKNGPLAFLPISKIKTSIVYSFKIKNLPSESKIERMIKKLNPYYEIERINKISKLKLKSTNLRKYYKDNVLAFGDLLHKLHPLAGQGFNMSIRDIKKLSKIIDKKIKLGLNLDNSVCSEFQNKARKENLFFSEGVDFVYEFFNSENKIRNTLIDSTVKYVGKNKFLNQYFKKIADLGL